MTGTSLQNGAGSLVGSLVICLYGCSVSPPPVAPIAVSLNSCQRETLAPGIYVAPNGDDANPGTAELPLATIEAARALFRGENPKAVVYLRGGTYELQSPLILTAEDSGLSLQGVPCETAIVSGGHSITGWQKVSDQSGRLPQVFHTIKCLLTASGWREHGRKASCRWTAS